MAQHVPGPWRVGPIDDTSVSTAGRQSIAHMAGNYEDDREWPIMEANARLIAAAPDLLRALQGLMPTNVNLNHPKWADDTNLPCDVSLGELRAAAAAIARALGKEG